MRLAGRPACPACRAQVDDAGFSVTDWTAIARSTRRTRHQPGLMKLKPLAPLLCLFIAVPGLSVAAEKTVYGLNEYARINDPDIQLAAKLDTGAKTASLSARDIKRFKRDGETWVRFYLATDNADDTPIEAPGADQQDQAPPRRLQPRRGQGLYRPSGDRAAGLHGQGDSHHRSEPDRPKCIPIPAFDRLGGLEEIRRTGRSEFEILGRETRLQT